MLNRFGGFQALLIIIVLAGASISCGSSDKEKSDDLPGIPSELRTELVRTCDYVDIIFYDSPASLSQDEPQSIQRALAFIDTKPASLDANCKPMGRISYISSGDITAEGDMYVSDQCQYIVFMKDNQPVYANKMSLKGVQFFEEILRGIQQQLPNQ